MLVNVKGILKKAQEGGYAVGLFNTTDTDMLEGVIAAAEELNSPIIIGTAEVLLPYGELKLLGPALVDAAKRAKVPVAVNFDHGLTFERCVEALQVGFSALMYDGSAKGYKQNVRETREMVELAHMMGVSVEGEIGHVGQASEDSYEKHDGPVAEREDMYTTPEEAKEFLRLTGVDALAVAIGTAHGEYKSKPILNLKRLQEIRAAVDVPLVLHGGSGLSDDDFRNCIKCGIAKVNIFTDICLAGAKATAEGLSQGMGYLELRNKKVNDIKEATLAKLRLFGSENKA